MTPIDLAMYLRAMTAAKIMSAKLVLHGEMELSVTFGPDFGPPPEADKAPAPGGWKTEVSDPLDPDPMGLGNLDAPFVVDASESVPE